MRRSISGQRNFAHEQFLWLRQVARNGQTLPLLAVRVAIALTGYFNRETHEAYPAHNTLAAELGTAKKPSAPAFRR